MSEASTHDYTVTSQEQADAMKAAVKLWNKQRARERQRERRKDQPSYQTQKKRQREKYHSDPEFRQKRIEYAKKHYARLKALADLATAAGHAAPE